METHVLSFKGIPEVGFYSRDDLVAYLKKEGKSLGKVHEDMENNPIPEWEVCIVEYRQP